MTGNIIEYERFINKNARVSGVTREDRIRNQWRSQDFFRERGQSKNITHFTINKIM
jgi:hypothetical protein